MPVYPLQTSSLLSFIRLFDSQEADSQPHGPRMPFECGTCSLSGTLLDSLSAVQTGSKFDQNCGFSNQTGFTGQTVEACGNVLVMSR